MSPSSVKITNTQCEVLNCTNADTTATITLALWNSLINKVKLGQTYTYTYLSTRSFNNTLSVTTTRDTDIKKSNDLDIEIELKERRMEKAQLTTIQAEASRIKIEFNKQCPRCNKNHQNVANAQFHHCEHCKIQRKATNYKIRHNGVITIDVPELT